MRHLVLIAALALAGCSPEMGAPSETVAGNIGGVARMEAQEAAAPEAAADGAGGEGGAVTPPGSDNPSAGTPLLAYIYGVALELPAKAVRPTMSKHEAACRAAGPAVCQVLGATVNASDDEQSVYGSIQLRAQPRWLEGFRAGLDAEARSAGGRVRETSVTSEDLTRQIVDTDARLRAQKTLRERLQQLLRTRPGKLEELLATERALAEVQGQIDSAESQLAVMRQRVATSLLNLSYQSKPNPVTGGTFEPVVDALTEFFGIVMMGIGFIIRMVAFLIPVALVLVPLGWLVLRWRRRRKAAKAAQAAQN
jgi:hypothetical protein